MEELETRERFLLSAPQPLKIAVVYRSFFSFFFLSFFATFFADG